MSSCCTVRPCAALPAHAGQAAHCPADALAFFPGLKDYQFPQDEAVAPSNPFLEEEEGLKKDSRLADLATELLMVATSRRSLRRSYSLLKTAVLPKKLDMENMSGPAAKNLSLTKQSSYCVCGAALSGPAWLRAS